MGGDAGFFLTSSAVMNHNFPLTEIQACHWNPWADSNRI